MQIVRNIFILFLVFRLIVCDIDSDDNSDLGSGSGFGSVDGDDDDYFVVDDDDDDPAFVEYKSEDPNVIANFSYYFDSDEVQRAFGEFQIKNVFLNGELTPIGIGTGSFVLKHYSQGRNLFFSLDYITNEHGMRGILNYWDETAKNVTEEINSTHDGLPIDFQATRLRQFYLIKSDHYEYVVSMNIPRLATANNSNFECYFTILSSSHSHYKFSCSEWNNDENNLIEGYNKCDENGNYRFEYTGSKIRMTEKGAIKSGETEVSDRELKFNDSVRNFTVKFEPFENGYKSTITFFYSNGTNDSYFYPDTFEPNEKHFYISTNEKHEKIVVNGHSKVLPSKLQINFTDPTGLFDNEFQTEINFEISYDHSKVIIETTNLEDSCGWKPSPSSRGLSIPDPNVPTTKSTCARRLNDITVRQLKNHMMSKRGTKTTG